MLAGVKNWPNRDFFFGSVAFDTVSLDCSMSESNGVPPSIAELTYGVFDHYKVTTC